MLHFLKGLLSFRRLYATMYKNDYIKVSIMKRLNDIKYSYNSLSVPGGGFVTGFLFHPRVKDILYARTDIGGVYSFDFTSGKWVSLCTFLTEFQHYLTRPVSIAIDTENEDMLFAMCGDSWKNNTNGKSALLVSQNRGKSFTEKAVPFGCNGNSPARSTSERLAFKKGRLIFGSQGEGLWYSDDIGESWEKADFPEENIAFVYAHPDYDIIIISCTGETNAVGSDRGHTLYVSYDSLKTFHKLQTPEPLNDSRCSHNGFVGGGIAAYKNKILISFTHSHKESWGGWNDFACDNGGGFDGRLFSYDITDGQVRFSEDLTPEINGFTDENPKRRLSFGLGGVDISGDTVIVCSIGGHGEGIFISSDGGKTYKVLKGSDRERYVSDVPYLKPEYNGGRAPLHWMSCLRIDPFNPDFSVLNTGTGVFAVMNVTKEPYLKTLSYGMEETVHMNIYGIPDGKNRVIDLVGDLGGFAFRDVTAPCENSFADKNNDRYITCLNADFVSTNPDIFITTARGNWTGQTTGGVIMTTDGGDSFRHIGFPSGISEILDETIENIRRPNYNSGWAAISADGKTILWTLAYKYMLLPCACAVRYDVSSESFTKVKVYDIDGNDISESDTHLKIFSDRKNINKFYGFGENGQLYISTDKGISFRQLKISGGFPLCRMSGIDGLKGCEIRFLPTAEGVCYAALLKHGLWKISFSEGCAAAERVSAEDDFIKTVGFGKGKDINTPAIFISGTLFGEYGFWRSYDNGLSWAKINTATQMYGGIVSMDGDFRKEGRVYIATGFYGGLYGDEI